MATNNLFSIIIETISVCCRCVYTFEQLSFQSTSTSAQQHGYLVGHVDGVLVCIAIAKFIQRYKPFIRV